MDPLAQIIGHPHNGGRRQGGAAVKACGGREDFSDSTNARPVVLIPSDVATNRPNTSGSGSTCTTSACSPLQRGEKERVTSPSNETPTAISRSQGVSKRYCSALPSPNRPSTPSDSA